MGCCSSKCIIRYHLRHQQRRQEQHEHKKQLQQQRQLSKQVSDPGSSQQQKRPKHEFLTDEERIRVTTTWQRLVSKKNSQAIGEKVFMRIFELHPETKNAFYSFKAFTSKGELLKSSLFKSHAIRFMLAIEVTMKNLDALDVVVQPTLQHLGNRHSHFKGFLPEYLNTFEQAMEEVWAEELGCWRFDSTTRRAWGKIFKMITESVLIGFREGKLDKERLAAFENQKQLELQQQLEQQQNEIVVERIKSEEQQTSLLPQQEKEHNCSATTPQQHFNNSTTTQQTNHLNNVSDFKSQTNSNVELPILNNIQACSHGCSTGDSNMTKNNINGKCLTIEQIKEA